MRRHALLRKLHDLMQPRHYLEIGVRSGLSLSLSRTRSIAVDPFYNVTSELHCDVHLVRSTSDEFFARKHPLAHFDEPVIDLAFIDGMHLAEFALRAFINVERYCAPGSVIVVDDVLPRTVVEAGRTRAERGAWAGDVYKMIDALRTHRPHLVVLELDTSPTGTLVVLLPDPQDRGLLTQYDDLVSSFVTPDPQSVPEWARRRTRAIDPRKLLEAPVWDDVRRLRQLPPAQSREQLSRVFAAAGLSTPRES